MTDHQLVISLFKNRYDNDPRPATATWTELAAKLSEHKTRPAKDRELWSPTYYAPGTTRAKVNVVQLSCLVLDFDDGTAPEEYTEAWSGYAHVIHSSYSHTPEAPRWRAVFPLSRTLWAADWDVVWHRLTAGLAPGKFDASCKDASRMYYLPAHPPGDEAYFTFAHEGEFLAPEAFAELVPDPPSLPSRPLAALPPAPPRAPGERVPPERLIEWALRRIVLEKHPEHDQGRHAGTFWLLCQLRDNGYDSEEASAICRTDWLHRLPPTDPAGKPSAYTEDEFAACWLSVYSQPARAPWPLPEPIPDPPEDLAPPDRQQLPEAAATKTPPAAKEELLKPPPSGQPGALAPLLRPEAADSGPPAPAFDFSSVYNLTWLQQADVAPPEWIVEDLIPEGLTELYGHAKLGKSFVALGLGIPVALGGIALSQFACRRGEVLYLAAEDAMWRMKERSGHLLTDVPSWPDGFFIDHDFGLRMDRNGRRKIEAWLRARPETRLLILDPWHAFRLPYPKGADIMAIDYDVAKALNLLGARYHCGIVVVHHSAKGGGNEDDVNGGAGSHGLAAGAGAVIRFQRAREENQAKMSVRGRDIRKEITWQLNRDDRTGFWNVEGDATVLAVNVTRQAIYQALVAHGPLKPKALSEYTGVALPTIQWTCQRMAAEGELGNERGTYTAKRPPGTVIKGMD